MKELFDNYDVYSEPDYIPVLVAFDLNHIIDVVSLGRLSQAARQGLAVLMASAVVVLKHETSILRQSHNQLTSILAWVITLCYQPCQIQFRSDERSRHHICAHIYRSCFLFFIYA